MRKEASLGEGRKRRKRAKEEYEKKNHFCLRFTEKRNRTFLRILKRQCIVFLKAPKQSNFKNVWQNPLGKREVGTGVPRHPPPPAPALGVTGLGRPSGNLQVTRGTARLAGPAAARRGVSAETRGARRCASGEA